MMTQEERKDVEEKLRECSEALACSNFDAFTKWEQDFLNSVNEQLEERGFLSAKQVDIVNKIWWKI